MSVMLRMLSKVAVAAGVAGLAAAGTGVEARSVRLDVEMSQSKVLVTGPRTAHLYVGVTGLDAPRGRRPALNVAIVLDRSGSMSGRKLQEAKRAAAMAVGMLRGDDIVSVVTYESTVDVLVPATKAQDKAAIRRAIRSIVPAGRTALFGGVSKGARELRKFLDENRVNTLLLLSDGLANVGPSSPGELARLGVSLAREGMAVTTIGLGLDYNEDLMTRLARASDGNHFFVENASDLEYAFATEFGDALSAVAQEVDIHVVCPKGVRPVRVLGRDALISGQEVRTTMGQVFADQTRYLVVELTLPPQEPNTALKVADVEATYRDLLTRQSERLRGSTRVTFASSQAAIKASTNEKVMAEVVRQIGTERNEVAMALRDEGKVEEAREAFVENAQFLEQQAQELDSDSLKKDATANANASRNLSKEEWRRERKVQQEMQLKAKSQRNDLIKDEKAQQQKAGEASGGTAR